MGETAIEFRGVDSLVYTQVLTDNNDLEGYTTGTVKVLAPVAEIAKTVEQGSETKYYDNKPMIVIKGTGSDEITLTVAALDLETLADITGLSRDDDTGAVFEGVPKSRYFALGYRFKLTDGSYRYVWRYKGSFNIPEENSQTEDDGTDATNQEITYIGINTTHTFAKGGSVKAMVVDERDGKADLKDFFTNVTTPDDLKVKTP